MRGAAVGSSGEAGPLPSGNRVVARTVVQADVEVLRLPAPVVGDATTSEVQAAIGRMLELLRRTGHPALSGPQVGYPGRVLAGDLSRTGRRPLVLVDPVVESESRETQVDAEGCLHFPGLVVNVERSLELTVRGKARSGQPVRIHVAGLMGRMVQHQLDHLDGELIVDHLPPAERDGAVRRARNAPRCSWSRC